MALYELADQAKQLDGVAEELRALKDMIADSEDLQRLIMPVSGSSGSTCPARYASSSTSTLTVFCDPHGKHRAKGLGLSGDIDYDTKSAPANRIPRPRECTVVTGNSGLLEGVVGSGARGGIEIGW